MSVVTLEEFKDQLQWTADLGAADDALMSRKIEAAQDHVERLLGFTFAATYGGTGQPPVPPALKEAIFQLAAFWFENREAATDGPRVTLPFGVAEIVNEYRTWTF